MALKTQIAIRAVPLSHIPFKYWPYCRHCRQVRMFDWHKCNADDVAAALTTAVESLTDESQKQ